MTACGFVHLGPVGRSKGLVFAAGTVDAGTSAGGETKLQLRNRLGLLGVVVKPAIKQLQKNPLRPPVITGVGGVHLTVPIVTKPNIVELLLVTGNILSGGIGRVTTGLDGILFGR